MFEAIVIIILVAFTIGGIWAFVFSKKVKNEGIETDAVVSRVELHEWGGGTGDTWAHDNITEEYYITYVNQEGQTVEALLSNPGDHTFKEGDNLFDVKVTNGNTKICIASNEGKLCMFNENDIRAMGRTAAGVRGMRLGKNDYIRDVYYLNDMEEKMIEHNDKELQLGHLKVTSRDTKGTKVRL